MKKIIILVGPPGVGKSTIAKLAKEKGINSLDIEEVHNETKKDLQHLLGDEYKEKLKDEMDKKIQLIVDNASDGLTIIGAGGYGSRFPSDKVIRVLLLPPKEIAWERFLERDSNDPIKKTQNQKFELIYDGFVERLSKGEGDYHVPIKENLTAEEILDRLLKI